MAIRNYSSTAVDTTLTSPSVAADTTLDVAATTGLPAAPFILVLEPDTANQELVLVTSVAGTTLTVTRGYDSTVAVDHAQGAVVRHAHGAIDFREANTHVNATTGVHGLGSSAVVGTVHNQTLTNKTISLADNTVSGTRAEFDSAVTDDNFAFAASEQTLTNKTFDSSSPTAFLPPGAMMQYAGPASNTPSGWLICQGQAVSRTTYAALYAVIGDRYGSGDGSTTFNVPDLREAFARGAFSDASLGDEGGATHISLSVDNLPAHSHGAGTLEAASAGDHRHTVVTQADTGDGVAAARGALAFESTANTSTDGAHTHEITGSTASVGGGVAKEVLPPYVTFNYIIKA